jgi:hypothetical protein
MESQEVSASSGCNSETVGGVWAECGPLTCDEPSRAYLFTLKTRIYLHFRPHV